MFELRQNVPGRTLFRLRLPTLLWDFIRCYVTKSLTLSLRKFLNTLVKSIDTTRKKFFFILSNLLYPIYDNCIPICNTKKNTYMTQRHSYRWPNTTFCNKEQYPTSVFSNFWYYHPLGWRITSWQRGLGVRLRWGRSQVRLVPFRSLVTGSWILLSCQVTQKDWDLSLTSVVRKVSNPLRNREQSSLGTSYRSSSNPMWQDK